MVCDPKREEPRSVLDKYGAARTHAIAYVPRVVV